MTEITITVTGTISPWHFNEHAYPFGYYLEPTIDYGGYFGVPGNLLTGDPFTVVWNLCCDFTGYIFQGHEIEGVPLDLKPPNTAVGTLTINDHKIVFGADGYQTVTLNNWGGNGNNNSALYTSIIDNPSYNSLWTGIWSQSPGIAGHYQPFHYVFNPTTDNLDIQNGGHVTHVGGSFHIGEYSASNETFGAFAVETMTLAVVPAPIIGAGLPGCLITVAILLAVGARRALGSKP